MPWRWAKGGRRATSRCWVTLCASVLGSKHWHYTSACSRWHASAAKRVASERASEVDTSASRRQAEARRSPPAGREMPPSRPRSRSRSRPRALPPRYAVSRLLDHLPMRCIIPSNILLRPIMHVRPSCRRRRQTRSRRRFRQRGARRRRRKCVRAWARAASPCRPGRGCERCFLSIVGGTSPHDTHLVDGLKVAAEVGQVDVGLDDVLEAHAARLEDRLEVGNHLPRAVLHCTLDHLALGRHADAAGRVEEVAGAHGLRVLGWELAGGREEAA